MPPSANTRLQMVGKWERLKRRASVSLLKDEASSYIVDISKLVLEQHPLEDDEVEFFDDDPKEMMVEMLPAPEDILSDTFYKRPIFPIALLRDVAALYNFGDIPEGLLTTLGLSAHEMNSAGTMTHVWFAHILECDIATMRRAVDCYKRSRGSPNPAVRTRTNSLAKGEHRANQNHVAASAPPIEAPTCEAGLESEDELRAVFAKRQQLAEVAVEDPYIAEASHNGRPTVKNLQSEQDDTRKASYVHQHFKSGKFTGDLSQSIELFIRNYQVCAQQHKFSLTQKADYFINMLEGPAKIFFFNNANDSMTFEQMKALMIREYNSNARQIQVKGTLETLRLGSFMAERELTDFPSALTKLVAHIDMLAPQAPRSYRDEDHKIGFLRKAVLGYEWASNPIARIVSEQVSFNTFVTSLHESLQIKREVDAIKDKEVSVRVVQDPQVLYQQYGRNPKHVQKYPRPTPNNAPRRTFEESRRRNECHRCGASWKPGHRCARGSMHDRARKRLQNGESAVHIVYDLIDGLEGELDLQMDAAAASDYESEADPAATHIQETASDLEVYEALHNSDDTKQSALLQASDEVWFTNALRSSPSYGTSAVKERGQADF